MTPLPQGPSSAIAMNDANQISSRDGLTAFCGRVAKRQEVLPCGLNENRTFT